VNLPVDFNTELKAKTIASLQKNIDGFAELAQMDLLAPDTKQSLLATQVFALSGRIGLAEELGLISEAEAASFMHQVAAKLPPNVIPDGRQ